MEALAKSVIDSYGLVGVMFLLPYVALGYMWVQLERAGKAALEREKAHAAALNDAHSQVVGAQQQRVTDAQQISAKLMVILTEQTALNRDTNTALDKIGALMEQARPRRA